MTSLYVLEKFELNVKTHIMYLTFFHSRIRNKKVPILYKLTTHKTTFITGTFTHHNAPKYIFKNSKVLCKFFERNPKTSRHAKVIVYELAARSRDTRTDEGGRQSITRPCLCARSL